jgi:hypothetical protein
MFTPLNPVADIAQRSNRASHNMINVYGSTIVARDVARGQKMVITGDH